MQYAAEASFELDDMPQAKTFASNLLSKSSKFQNDWNYGNAIHDGNLVLGRVAFINGDIEKAKTHLLLAGKTPGSPQLNTLGPNMSLANDLLDASEEEIVIEYFKDCKKFWEMNDGRLDSWIASINVALNHILVQDSKIEISDSHLLHLTAEVVPVFEILSGVKVFNL